MTIESSDGDANKESQIIPQNLPSLVLAPMIIGLYFFADNETLAMIYSDTKYANVQAAIQRILNIRNKK